MTIALGLLAATSWAGVNLWLASISRVVSALPALLVLVASSLVATGPLALWLDGVPHGRALDGIPYALAAGLLEVAAFRGYLAAVRRGSMAVIAPLIGLEGGVAALIAIGGGEHVNTPVASGLALAVLGGSLACFSGGERRVEGAGWALVSALLFGIMLVLYGAAAPLGPFTIVTLARTAGVLALAPMVIRGGVLQDARRRLAPLAVMGILDAGAFVAFAAAAARGPVSVASVCAAQFSTISVVVAIILLRERPAPVQLAGIALTLVGTTLLAAA
jgi:drug/metabolite transporter (DMT)-like permease